MQPPDVAVTSWSHHSLIVLGLWGRLKKNKTAQINKKNTNKQNKKQQHSIYATQYWRLLIRKQEMTGHYF